MKDTPMTAEEVEFARRILRTATDYGTMMEIAQIVVEAAKDHEDLTVTQVMALSAAAGIIRGTAKGLQRERDARATGGNLTSLDI